MARSPVDVLPRVRTRHPEWPATAERHAPLRLPSISIRTTSVCEMRQYRVAAGLPPLHFLDSDCSDLVFGCGRHVIPAASSHSVQKYTRRVKCSKGLPRSGSFQNPCGQFR